MAISKFFLLLVTTFLFLSTWVNAQFNYNYYQTTEKNRLYGTFNVNRGNSYYEDDPRNRYYGSDYRGNNDTLYWERRNQLRAQYGSGLTRDPYNTDYGSSRYYDTSRASDLLRPSGYDSRNPQYNPNSQFNPNFARHPDTRVYDPRNPNYGTVNTNYDYPGAAGYSPPNSNVAQTQRDRERELERERERVYYLNARQRANANPINYNNQYGPNNQRLPACGVFDEWRPDLMGQCRPDYAANVQERDITVTTPYGRIRGFYVHLFDGPGVGIGDRPGVYHQGKLWRTISAFLGVPYATPPVNEGRFKPPRAKRAWSIWDAVDFGPACPQPIQYVGASKGVRYMNEDCLYLNIFTPNTGAVAEKYPVIFYIHGGEFERGSSNSFPGHMLAAVGDVVVVTVNYRLGALGFLSTANEYSPGNYGMLDLAMALQWVYDNAYAFNGNKDMITVTGPGSGAGAAGLLAIAPGTRNMVRQVFGQSGSPLADWAAIHDLLRMQNTSRVYGERMGCVVEKSFKLIECLRSRSFEELGNVRFTPDIGTWAWAPVVDREIRKPASNWYEGWEEKDWTFLPEVPEELIRLRQFNPSLRYMTGVTENEAAYVVYNNKSLSPSFTVSEEFFDQKIREYIHRYNYTYNPDGVYRAIKYMYTYWPDPKNVTHIREEFINFMSDALYKSPVDKMIRMMVENNVPTYSYVLNSTIEALNYPYWSRVPHNIEYYFLSGAPFMDPEFYSEDLKVERKAWLEEDRRMSEFFMKTLANFARFGRPTPVAIYNINWPEMRSGWLQYLNLNRTDNSTLEWNYRTEQTAFWSEYMPSVVGFLVSTYRPFTEYWWEPNTPISVAFWSTVGVCVIVLILAVFAFCLWRGAKKANDKLMAENYLNGDMVLTENIHAGSKDFSTNGDYRSEKLKLDQPSTLV